MSRRPTIPTHHTVLSVGARQRHARLAVMAIILGLAVVPALGHDLMFVSPTPASVVAPDKSPDQSTGPTDPNGPPY